ncbi:MAG: fatty acid CoA ligase family protein [Planctomycetota bacterium]
MTTRVSTIATSADTVGTSDANVASFLARTALRAPARAAIVEPLSRRGRAWRSTTYSELDARTRAIAAGLVASGVEPGTRAAVFVRPGAELIAIVHALFLLRAVPVLVDPGLGKSAVIAALARSTPEVFFGVPLAQLVRALHAARLPSIRTAITVGAHAFPGTIAIDELVRRGRNTRVDVRTSPGDEAAVLFTSGSTGPAKGVVYTHAQFQAQIAALRALYRFEPGEVDLACFPLFALFAPALEITAVFPRIDFTRPGRCDPADIVHAIETHAATTTFGSPAIWRRVQPYCAARGLRLATLRRVLIAGAPVEPTLIAGLRTLLARDADVHTPYGATECLPVTSIAGREIDGDVRARSESGAGTCIGRAAPGVDIEIVRIGDEPIGHWSEDLRVAHGTLGEICVRSAAATRAYDGDPGATRAAQIEDGARFWHRMGDLGYFDGDGRLWFCGRKSHRLQTSSGLIAPVPTENVYNRHPRVHRSALVGIGARGSERPLLVVQPKDGAMPRGRRARARFEDELRSTFSDGARARAVPLAHVSEFRFRSSLPVDVRHNAKIRREELKRWAERHA